jgi:hypothetical protein
MTPFEELKKLGRQRVYAPLVLQSNRLRSGVRGTPSEGVYFLYPHPLRAKIAWGLFAYRFDEFSHKDHAAVWEHHVAALVAAHWCATVRTPLPLLEKRLVGHPRAFPRGRVARQGSVHKVYWGKEPLGEIRIPKADIEVAFSVKGTARWEFEEHERCLAEDLRAVTALLGIEPSWAAV